MYRQKGAPRLLANLTISLLTFVVLIILSEFGVRLVFWDVTSTADTRGYFSRRWYESIRLNTWDFRETEVDPDRPAETFRIAVIGDSFTFGQGIEEHDRFSNLLEQQLVAGGDSYEVLNFGRPGAEIIDHVQILKDPVLATSPDFILLQWYTNDFEGHDKRGRPQPMTLPSLFVGKSGLLFLLNTLLINLQTEFGLVGSYEDYLLERFGDPDSEFSVAAQVALQEFIEITKREGIPLGIVLIARSSNHDSSSSSDFLVERVLAMCDLHHIHCVDLRSTFAPYAQDRSQLWVNSFDPHLGPAANRMISECLLESFEEMWRANSRR
jgi:lysophospholipase L1-like esterase